MKATPILTLTLTLLAAPLLAAPGKPAEDAVAVVNGEIITRDALVKRLLTYQGARNLESMINQVLVRQAAARERVTVTDKEVEDRVNQVRSRMRTPELFQKWLAQSDLTEPLFREQVRYTLLTEKLVAKKSPVSDSDLDQARVRLIVVASEAEGREIIRSLKQGGDFIQIAKQKSLDKETGPMGGAMPEFTRADYPDLWQAVARLKPGEVTNPVKLGPGYAVVKLEARLPASTLTDQQRDQLRRRLLTYRIATWLDTLRKQAKVTYPVPLTAER
jgi:foldase protein PrsA